MIPYVKRVRVGASEARVVLQEIRPDEILLPGEEFLVVAHSPRGAAADLLSAVANLAGAMAGGNPAITPDRTSAAQAFAVVLGLEGGHVAQALNRAGGPGDEWGIFRANYAAAISQIPELTAEAASRAGRGMTNVSAWFAEMAAEWGRRVVSGAGKGLGAGAIALALGAAAGGLVLYSWAKR